jgi:chemotaxis regulatin CheY-phosphate phosphatase CheZ
MYFALFFKFKLLFCSFDFWALGECMQEDVLEKMISQIEIIKDNPYYGKIKSFLLEIRRLLNQVNDVINDNVQKMPGAAKKIYKVTEATEAATNEILDAVDSVLKRIDEASENFAKIVKVISDDKMVVLDAINTAIQFINADVDKNEIINYLTEFRFSYANKNEKIVEFNKIIEESHTILTNIINDSTQIMMSSQVQDITSQQLAAVNHTLETIQNKLKQILFAIDTVETEGLMPAMEYYENTTNVSTLHREIAFDPDAVKAITNKESKQNDVDDLINKHNSGTITEEDMKQEIDQDDIDALLNSFTSFSSNEEEQASAPEMSQDDIDSLFG